MLARSKTVALARIALLAGPLLACASKPPHVTAAWEKHPPRAILVTVVDHSGHPGIARDLEKSATREVQERGYGTIDTNASMHIVIRQWMLASEPLSLGREHIEVDAKLYDNASGELLWRVAAGHHDDDDEECESAGDWAFHRVFDWAWANTPAGALTATRPEDVAATLIERLPPRKDPPPAEVAAAARTPSN